MKRFYLLGILCALFLSGCVTTTMQTKATMSQSIFIDPVAKNKQTIYIAMRNTSGQNINLLSKVLGNLQAKGYTIVDDPKMANFILQANVLYCNIKQENNATGAAVLGAGVGAGVGGYNHGSMTGTIAGGAIGALVGGIAGKLTEDTIYQMQVDINIRQKVEGGTINTNASASRQATVTDGRRAGFLNSFGGDVRDTQGGGRLQDNRTNYNEQIYTTDYSEKQTTLFAEATKLNLTLEEAIPVLEDKIANQISGIF
ncbi:complement resistance protein TraT [Helicobacter burdigaliensis]|uniref:complement resistance protein TraT n=1 Tax=Helicobacter burdigaliensis TaxID=2315334 RepID=UPI000EF67DAA|nr:complement resistance protein TraT [Helicobacter burdigaliensis]